MKLSVENYKSIVEKMSININGLSVISGANSSGKSSFMQPFLILKQTIENNSDGESLILNGDNVNITEANQILYKGNDTNVFSLSIELNNEELKSKKKKIEKNQIEFVFDNKQGFIVSFASNNLISIKKNMSQDEIDNLITTIKKKDPLFKNIFEKFNNYDELIPGINTNKALLSIEFTPKKMVDKNKELISFGINPSRALEKFSENIIHIPGIRSFPERQYEKEPYNRSFRGRFDKYTATVIYNWCSSDKKEDFKKLEQLISLIKRLKLASNILATKINEAHISLSVSRYMNSNKDDLVDLADVGFGISQVLPILVALIEAKSHNTIYIEQPEIHLHPAAQYELSSILCEYVNLGKNIIVETHSSILIRGIQIAIAKKEILHNKISLNWFIQDEKGQTTVYESELDEFGSFGDFPIDFDDIYLNADSAYLDAVEELIS